MGREEQVEEREVLESIFPDELTDISETEFRVLIKLDVIDEEDSEPPSFSLQVRYPEEYPDVAPHLDLMAAADSGTHEHFNISNDRDQLLEGLDETIQENLGIVMVFTIVSALKEAAEQLIQDRKEGAAKEQEEKLLAAEREENKKFHGTPVTPETFLKWRTDFMKEMEEKEKQAEEERLAELKRAKVKEPVKLTGRQLWERGLAGKGDEEDDDESVPADEMQKLQVEA